MKKPHYAYLVFVFLLGVVFFWGLSQFPNSQIRQSKTSAVGLPKKKPDPVIKSHLLIVGDVNWGREINLKARANTDRFAWPFSGLSTFDKPSYDAWVANLECPVTPHLVTLAQESGPLIFNCEPGYLQEFAKWFDIVSLANNHTSNVNGASGLKETRSALDGIGVQYFGHFDNSVKTDTCEVVSLPVKLGSSGSTEEKQLLPFAFCGFHGVYRTPTADEIAVIGEYSKLLPTIVMPHMGTEYQPAADSIKTTTYRSMVEAGADIVIGAHPHWVQNTEVYKDKLIFYSAGNFIFDQHFDEDVKMGAGLDINIEAKKDSNLSKWLALGDQCKAFQDGCLKLASEQGLIKPKFKWQFNVVPRYNNALIAQKGDAAAEQKILQRTNWTQTYKQLLGSAFYNGQ